MKYRRRYTPEFEDTLRKFKRKDKHLFNRIIKKIDQILERPGRFEHLRYPPLKCCEHVHVNPFVIVFDIVEELVTFHYAKHHNKLL